jgi:hypothetical protein
MEEIMKTLMTALALAGVVIAGPAFAAKTCIDTRKIVSSKSDDGKTMVFKMKNGDTLINRLQGRCPDLKYYGYVWVLRGGDMNVCENSQSFQVLQSGQVCVLGKFDAPVGKQAMTTPPMVWDTNKVQAPR